RVPRKPYTTRASCGPALRYSRANMAISKMRVNAISPAMAKIISMLIVLVLLNFICGCRRIRKLFPRPDIGDTALVASHNDFGSFGDFDSVIAARGSSASDSGLRKDHFTGAGRTNVAVDGSEYADPIVVRGVEFLVMANENLGEEKKHDRCPDESAGARDTEPEQEPEAREAGEEVTGAAEPGEKGGNGAKINWANLTRVPSARVRSMRVIAANM